MSFKADLQILISLTVPIRLAFARDRAVYAVACDEEVCYHYGEKPSKVWQLRLTIEGYIEGLTTKEIPQWFIDSWFSAEGNNSSPRAVSRPSM